MDKVKKMKKGKSVEDGFYIAGWCLMAAAVAGTLAVKISGIPAARYAAPCMFHTLTGLYCPGCGGTRAIAMLLQGKIFRSFVYHPFVLYVAVLGGWFMVSQTIERVSGGRIKSVCVFVSAICGSHSRSYWQTF